MTGKFKNRTGYKPVISNNKIMLIKQQIVNIAELFNYSAKNYSAILLPLRLCAFAV